MNFDDDELCSILKEALPSKATGVAIEFPSVLGPADTASAHSSTPSSPLSADSAMLPLPLPLPVTTIQRRQFACDQCEKGFNAEKDLSRHRELVHNRETTSRRFPCWQCDKAFALAYDLKRHLSSHGDERRYVCSTCKAAFKLKTQLSRHEHTHSEIRAHACGLCGRAYKLPNQLKRHQQETHSNERPHTCECGAAFKQRAHLLSHQHRRTCTPLFEHADRSIYS